MKSRQRDATVTPGEGAGPFDPTLAASPSGPAVTPRLPTPATSHRWVGSRIEHFQVERPLGRGGMGEVYLARDTSLDRPVAIKVLPDELVGDPVLEERFVREARAQARLTSPHVVHLYYIGHLPASAGKQGSLFFAMELVDGEPLEAVLEARERLDPEEGRRLMLQVAQGLRDAHAADIIHRDIKPSNLLRDRQGRAKIADFGLAKPVSREGVTADPAEKAITAEGIVLGTPLYMSPEQARSEPVDHRSDMYSLGCTFYHLLAGRPPFDGRTPIEIVARHLTERARPIREVCPAVPPALSRVIARLTERDREARYGTWDEVIAALEGAAPQPESHAGFWVRGAGVLLECAIMAGLVAVLKWPGLVLHLVYVTLAHAYFGQTASKFLLRIAVRRVHGGRLGLARSVVRTLASVWLPLLVAALTMFEQGIHRLRAFTERMKPSEADELEALVIAVAIPHLLLTLLWIAGLVMAAFDPRKRALHDLVAGSEVVYQLQRPSSGPGALGLGGHGQGR